MNERQKSICQFCEAELLETPESSSEHGSAVDSSKSGGTGQGKPLTRTCPRCGKKQLSAENSEPGEIPSSVEGTFAKPEITENSVFNLENLENSLPWNGIFLALMMIFLLLTFFNNK